MISFSPVSTRGERAVCCEDHEELKTSDRWEGLVFIGIQHTPADDSGPAEDLELRNCECGTTLAKVVAS